MRRHLHNNAYATGNDGIAPYTVNIHCDDVGFCPCSACKRMVLVTIMYRDGVGGITVALQTRADIDIANTILKTATNCLCLDCWARFQRQIVHIESGFRGKKAA